MMHGTLRAEDAMQRLGRLIAPADMVIAVEQHQPVGQAVDCCVNAFKLRAELAQRGLLLPGKPVQALDQRRPDAPADWQWSIAGQVRPGGQLGHKAGLVKHRHDQSTPKERESKGG